MATWWTRIVLAIVLTLSLSAMAFARAFHDAAQSSAQQSIEAIANCQKSASQGLPSPSHADHERGCNACLPCWHAGVAIDARFAFDFVPTAAEVLSRPMGSEPAKLIATRRLAHPPRAPPHLS